MKKIIIASFMFIFCSITIANADCISAFNEAWDDANEEFQVNSRRCESALSKKRCMREADAIFGTAIDEAGKAYYHCML